LRIHSLQEFFEFFSKFAYFTETLKHGKPDAGRFLDILRDLAFHMSIFRFRSSNYGQPLSGAGDGFFS
jgi:hypothetical protein